MILSTLRLWQWRYKSLHQSKSRNLLSSSFFFPQKTVWKKYFWLFASTDSPIKSRNLEWICSAEGHFLSAKVLCAKFSTATWHYARALCYFCRRTLWCAAGKRSWWGACAHVCIAAVYIYLTHITIKGGLDQPLKHLPSHTVLLRFICRETKHLILDCSELPSHIPIFVCKLKLLPLNQTYLKISAASISLSLSNRSELAQLYTKQYCKYKLPSPFPLSDAFHSAQKNLSAW